MVPTDSEGRVTAFVEKPPRDEAPTNEINAGTYVLEPSVLERIPEGGRVSIERETFPAMVRDGNLFARSDDSYWLDTGTPAAYLEANFDYVAGKRGPVVAPGLVDSGRGVLVEGESVVSGDVFGPAVIFAGCVVESGRARGAQHPRSRHRHLRRGRRRRLGVDGRLPRGGRRQGGGLRHGSPIRRSDSGATSGRSRCSAPTRSSRRAPWSTANGCRAKKALVRTLVTGGAGFIGSNLVDRLLAEGHEVDVVDDFSTGSLSNLAEARKSGGRSLHIHHLDITAPAVTELMARRRPELVFHLAAQADVRVSVARPAHDANVNVIGSLHVLEGARQAEAERVVFAASGGTLYGDPSPDDAAGARVASAAAVVALRGLEEVGHRLPRRLPRAARPRVQRARPRQRVRPAAGSPR